MTKIDLHLQADTPEELQEVIQRLAGAGLPVIVGTPNLAEKPAAASKKNNKATTTPEPDSTPVNPPDPEPKKEPAPVAAPKEDKTKEVKIEDLRDALKPLGSEKARALVSDFGAAKLSEVPVEKYAELLAEAKKRAAANG